MALEPELGDLGFGIQDYKLLSPRERAAELSERRAALASCCSQDGFERAKRWLVDQGRLQRISRRHTSYGLKHLAEPEIGYVTSGEFIAAAIALGLRYRRCSRTSPNAFLGIAPQKPRRQRRREPS